MPARTRLCVSNQKGGVGKTTVAINLAGALNERGKDVLFVDLDPQGNATEGLDLIEAYDANPPTILDALVDGPDDVTTDELVYEHQEMDVVASNIDMTGAEATLLGTAAGDRRLEAVLDRMDEAYDYVVVDCPPTLGALTDNALLAAPNLVVPALAESTSKRSLELLFDYVRALELDYDVEIEPRALVVNRIEHTTEAESMLEWFEEALPDVPRTEVRKRVALQRAFSEGHSIFAGDVRTDMEAAFRELASTIDETFDDYQVST